MWYFKNHLASLFPTKLRLNPLSKFPTLPAGNHFPLSNFHETDILCFTRFYSQKTKTIIKFEAIFVPPL